MKNRFLTAIVTGAAVVAMAAPGVALAKANDHASNHAGGKHESVKTKTVITQTITQSQTQTSTQGTAKVSAGHDNNTGKSSVGVQNAVNVQVNKLQSDVKSFDASVQAKNVKAAIQQEKKVENQVHITLQLSRVQLETAIKRAHGNSQTILAALNAYEQTVQSALTQLQQSINALSALIASQTVTGSVYGSSTVTGTVYSGSTSDNSGTVTLNTGSH